MSELDEHNRSLTIEEANELAIRESVGHLEIVADREKVFAVSRRPARSDETGIEGSADIPHVGANSDCEQRRIEISRLSLTAWGVFEMARAVGPRPERMIHGHTRRSIATQFA
jgi:hypothetical protein